MTAWHFIPWTAQYIIGAVVTSIITIYVYQRNPNNRAVQFFLMFGALVIIWQITIFLHRNAPDAQLSKQLFCIGISSVIVGSSTLLAAILNVPNERNSYTLVLLPAILVSIATIIFQPFKVVWTTNHGWSWSIGDSILGILMLLFGILYAIIILIASIILIKNYPKLLKKFFLIASAWVGINTFGVLIINFVMIAPRPNTPPLGGILTTISFLIIAYAFTLPVGRVTLIKTTKISEAYHRFLTHLYENIPGREMGNKVVKFEDYLNAMGLNSDVKIDPSGNFMINSDNFTKDSIAGYTDTILRGLKVIPVKSKTMNHFTDVINITFDELSAIDQSEAEVWGINLLKNHGAFLYQFGVLDKIKFGNEKPEILKYFKGKKSVVIQMNKPINIYSRLDSLTEFGFKILCISKYPIELIIKKSENSKDILNLNDIIKKSERINKSKNGLKKLIVEEIDIFMQNNDYAFIIVDCLDQILTYSGNKETMNLIDYFNKRNGNFNILYILNPEIINVNDIKLNVFPAEGVN